MQSKPEHSRNETHLGNPKGCKESSRWSESAETTFFSLHYHIVFSTKERRPFIKPEWQPRLRAYLRGIIKGMNGVPEIVGGVEDHVHAGGASS